MHLNSRKWIAFAIVSLMFVFLASFGLFAEGSQEEEAAATTRIDWNSPNMVDRLTGDTYTLPDGWEAAVEGVEEITFGNAGGMSGDIATLMNILRFEDLTGIKINYIGLPPNIIDNKALVALSTEDPNMHSPCVRAYMTLATFASAGWLENLDDMWNADVEALYGTTEILQYKGSYYAGMVVEASATSFYRPSWFEKAGVGEPPDNFQELFPALKKVQAWARDNVGEDVYATAFEGSQALMRPLVALMHSQGAYIYSDGEYHFESQEWRNAFSYLVNLVKEGLATEEVISYVFHDAGRFLGMGKGAYIPFLVNSYQMKYQSEFPMVEDDWAMQIPPKWGPDDPESNHSTGFAAGCTAVPVHLKENEKNAVKLWIDYLRSEEARRNEVVVEGNESSMFRVYDDPDVAKKVDWDLADRAADIIKKPHPPHVSDIPNREVRKTMMQYARAEVFPAGFPEVRAQIDENYVKAATGQISIDEALQNIIDYVNQF